MDEITEVQRLLDPPRGLQQHTVQAARYRLMRAAAAPAPAGRRRVLTLTAVATTAAATAVVAVAATRPAQPQQAALAAWTVNRAADNSVTVTLREFRDPQGLQRKLTAAGVPALVQDGPSPCPFPYQAIPGNKALIGQVVTRDMPRQSSLAIFTIHPSAIPAGAQLDIVFPYSGTDRTAKPTQTGDPASSPEPSSSSSGNGASVAHPVAIRLIPVSQPECVKPSPEPSASQQGPSTARK